MNSLIYPVRQSIDSPTVKSFLSDEINFVDTFIIVIYVITATIQFISSIKKNVRKRHFKCFQQQYLALHNPPFHMYIYVCLLIPS